MQGWSASLFLRGTCNAIAEDLEHDCTQVNADQRRGVLTQNIELMGSLSSALLFLSMQQVSTQAYIIPRAYASWQVCSILENPGFILASGSSAISWALTSPSSQVCDRIAYRYCSGCSELTGIASSFSDRVLINHIVIQAELARGRSISWPVERSKIQDISDCPREVLICCQGTHKAGRCEGVTYGVQL